jgi:X-Pro dipeptidyl-peptidase
LIDPANPNLGIGSQHGDVNAFWLERDYTRNADKVTAAVFMAHAMYSDSFRNDQALMWWNALEANGVPRKLWLSQHGYDDIFDVHRARWVDALHRWFDHWLYGVENGIMSEPSLSIEDDHGGLSEHTDWPVAGTRGADVYLRAAADPAAAGTVGAVAGGGMRDRLSYTTIAGDAFVDYGPDPTGSQANRRVFLTAPLTRDVQLSGQAIADLRAALGGRTTIGLSIIDHGPNTRVFVVPSAVGTRSCWGASSAGDACTTVGAPCAAAAQIVETACYPDLTRPFVSISWNPVSRGVIDPENRNSMRFGEAEPVVPGQPYRLRFTSDATQWTIRAGHRIGVVIHGADSDWMNGFGAGSLPVGVPVTLDTRVSKVTLPVVGGYDALAAAGAFDDPTSIAGGTVPPTLSLSLGAPATFGAFVPGVAREYTASTTANVISTAGDAALSSSDPGHLTNGAFSLPQPLQVSFSKSTWSAPTSNESVAVNFTQRIGASDALRTGTYSKTLTFTLSTTTP